MALHLRHIFTAILILLLNASLAMGASLSVEPSGIGVSIIKGNSMDGVAGIELILTYDTATLASPTVTQGSLISGAMLAANTNNPGSIRIAVISTKMFSGSGPVATVSFATYKGVPAVTISSSRMIDSKGLPVISGTGSPSTTTGFITSPGVPFSQPNSTSTVTAPEAAASTYLGIVNMPSDASNKSDTNTADTDSELLQFTEPATAKSMDPPIGKNTVETIAENKQFSEPQKPAAAKITSYKGVIENFRAYTGEKSPAIFIALFNKKIAPNIRQEPAIALNDGKTPVKLVVELKGNGEKSPNFALNGARLVSLNKDDDSFTWIVEALPQVNMMQASLTILTDMDIMEYPFTLTPPVEGVSPAEADFSVFLKDSTAATPKRDLNNDGKHDYLDDYIYTANYLITKYAAGIAKK